MNIAKLKHDLTYALSGRDIASAVGANIPLHAYPDLKKFKDINQLFICPYTQSEYDAAMILYQTGHRKAGERFGHWCCLTRIPITLEQAQLELKGSSLNKYEKQKILHDISNGNNMALCFYDPYGMKIDNQLLKIPAVYRRQTGQTRNILKDLMDKSDYPTLLFNPYHHQSYSVRLPNGQRTHTAVCGRHCSNFINSRMTPETYNKYLKNLKDANKIPNYDMLIINLIN